MDFEKNNKMEEKKEFTQEDMIAFTRWCFSVIVGDEEHGWYIGEYLKEWMKAQK